MEEAEYSKTLVPIYQTILHNIPYVQLHAGFLLGLLFNSEDEGNMFLQNGGWLSMDYTALQPRRQIPHNTNKKVKLFL
jgi:hypothetical protein